MESGQQLRSLWAARWWLLLFAVATAVATYFVSNSRSPVYEAEALVQILPREQEGGLTLSTDQLLQVTNFYAQLAHTRRVYDAARAEGSFLRTFNEDIEVEAQPDLLVLAIRGKAGDPDTAARWTGAYARALVNQVADLEAIERERTLRGARERAADIRRRLVGLTPDSSEALALTAELEALQSRLNEEELTAPDRIRVIQSAVRPSEPASPKPLRDALLAFILALVVGGTVVVLRALLVDRFGSVEEAAVDLHLPVLAELPRARPHSQEAVEAFRKLRAQVEFSLGATPRGSNSGGHGAAGRRNPPNVILVTSPESGAGKSYITSNLARALAADGRRVAAVDGDLRRPALHAALGVPAESGLGDLLHSGRADEWALHVKAGDTPMAAHQRGGSLDVLTAGTVRGDTAEALSSETLRELTDAISQSYDFVIFDSPPVLAIVDAVVLSRYADAVLLVVDANRSRRRNIRRGVQTLRAVEAPLLGLVYNRSKISALEYGYYGTLPSGPPARDPERAERAG
jgi:capsular exopolysaccharide synthesis family protein